MALLMTASSFLVHRKISNEISSEAKASQAMPSTFATKYARLQITNALSCICCQKIVYGSRGNTF